jgi:hypothetical protein
MGQGWGRDRFVARIALHGVWMIAPIWASAGQAAEPPRQNGRVETVHFASAPVRIVRGGMAAETAMPPAAAVRPMRVERIVFEGAVPTSVTILRGPGDTPSSPTTMSDPAAPPAFERVAHAVDGVESSHGADPNMWRADIRGPQGPMQVSEAAARDSGGGDRFDLEQNRLLGRAYLARMLWRYGNWPDALAAYNWGPGKVDRWIAGGRDIGRLPPETIRYIDRVLREARRTGDDRPPGAR